MGLPAAIYARVSSVGQKDNTSIETQVADCRRFAEGRGWTVVGVYTDVAVSGRKELRPELDRLRADVARGVIKAVVVWKIDRLARKTAHALTLIDEAFKGVIFESVTEPLDRYTSGGRFGIAVVAAAAQLTSDQLGERIRRARRHQAERGRWTSSGAPYGYTAIDGVLTANEDAPTVQLLYDLYVTGRYGYAKLADELNRRGLTMRDRNSGDRYPFGVTAVAVILKNPTYRGLIPSNGTLFPGTHTALISDAQWEAAAAIRGKHRNGGGVPRHLPPGLLIGIAVCGRCGSRMWNQVASSRQDQREYAYHYYRCGGVHRRICRAPMTQAPVIDAQILAIVAGLTMPAAALDVALGILAAPRAAPPAPDQDAIRAQMDRLTRVYVAGRLDEAAYEVEYAILAASLAVAPAPPAHDYAAAALALRDIPGLIAEAPRDEQRALLAILFERVVIQDGAITDAVLHPTLAEVWSVVEGVASGEPDATQPTPRRPLPYRPVVR